jgi:hypothetical protein
MVQAWYLIIVLVGQGWPVLAGPYTERCACQDVREWVEARGYVTGGCSVMSTPQDAINLLVGYLP